MVYALKLLFFVLLIGSGAWVLLRPVFAGLLTPAQYKRAGLSLFVLTVISFLSFQPAIYIALISIAAFVCSRYLGSGNSGKVNAFLLFLLPLPPLTAVLGGVQGINYIMLLDHERALALVLLAIPAVGLLFRQRQRGEVSLRSVDMAMLAIQAWTLLLDAQAMNLTGLLRTFGTSFVDAMIPYYVITRTLRTPEQLREAGSYLLMGCLFMASVGCVESLLQHNLYAGLQWIYGQRWESTVDLRRGMFLRVDSSATQPIVLGFCMVFGMGLWTWLRGAVPRTKMSYGVYLIFGFALVSTWSRGPWVGAVLLFGAMLLQRVLSGRAFALTVVLALAAVATLRASGGDDAVMAALTAVFGSAESDISTIVYRRDLFDATIALIKQSPWMGVPNFENALESFRQGEGIIDIVNSYLVIMINSGVVGLVLFFSPFLVVLVKLLGARDWERLAGKQIQGSFALVFIALILTMLFIIFTVSSIGVIPYLLGLGVSLPAAWLLQYREASLVSAEASKEPATPTGLKPGFADVGGLLPR